MKSLTTLTKKLALTAATTAFFLIATAAPSVAADQNQQSSQGQFSQGNFYYVKDETQNGTWGNTIGGVNACDELRYKIYLYNPGPSFLSSASIQVSLPGGSANSNTSTATAYSINADPTKVSANAVVNLTSSRSISYESGSTELLDGNNNLIKNLPDGITQGGVNIGDIAASGTEFVQFNAKVNCPTTPPTVTPPTVTPPTTTTTSTPTPAAPTALVNTGPGSVIGIFAAATIAGTAFYRRLLATRLSRR